MPKGLETLIRSFKQSLSGHLQFAFMKFKNPKIEKLYEYISGVSHVAYLDRFLISNDVLCKQYVCGQMAETILNAAPPQKTTFFFVIKKIFFLSVQKI